MDDEYTKLKRDEEALYVKAEQLKRAIQELKSRLLRSDHPLRHERVKQLDRLLEELTV